MRLVRKMLRPDPDGSFVSPRATVAAWLVMACLVGCATPPPYAWVVAREQFGSAPTPSNADNVKVSGLGFSLNRPVVLRVANLPNYTQDIVWTVPGTIHAGSDGSLDYSFTPPCFYNVGDYPVISLPIRLLATDEAGWTVYDDTLTAQSFACDVPPVWFDPGTPPHQE